MCAERLDPGFGLVRFFLERRVQRPERVAVEAQLLLELLGQIPLDGVAVVGSRGKHSLHVAAQDFGQLLQPFFEVFGGKRFRLLVEGHAQRFAILLELRVVRLPCLSFRWRDIGQVSAPLRIFAGGPESGADVWFEPVVFVERSLKDIHQPVVIPLRQRIEFVAVAAGALQGQAHDSGTEHVDLVGDDLQAVRNKAGDIRPGSVRCHAEKAGCHQVVVQLWRDLRGVLVIGQLVARKLFQKEAIVRLVGVERADDIIAVPPSMRPRQILFALPFGVRVAGEVEPVTAPTLTVPRRGEEPVDPLLVSVRVWIIDECLDFGRFGRQAR